MSSVTRARRAGSWDGSSVRAAQAAGAGSNCWWAGRVIGCTSTFPMTSPRPHTAASWLCPTTGCCSTPRGSAEHHIVEQERVLTSLARREDHRHHSAGVAIADGAEVDLVLLPLIRRFERPLGWDLTGVGTEELDAERRAVPACGEAEVRSAGEVGRREWRCAWHEHHAAPRQLERLTYDTAHLQRVAAVGCSTLDHRDVGGRIAASLGVGGGGPLVAEADAEITALEVADQQSAAAC